MDQAHQSAAVNKGPPHFNRTDLMTFKTFTKPLKGKDVNIISQRKPNLEN